MAASNKSYDDFLAAVRERESSDRYNFISKAGYLGAYQFAEITMKNLGYYESDGTSKQDWIGDFTGKDSVTSKQKLLTTPPLQDKVFDKMLELYWEYANYSNFHMVEHVGQTIDGLKVTPSLIVAGNHVLGIGKMRDFLDGKYDLSAGMHTYLSGLSGYELPFVEGSGDGGADDPAPVKTPTMSHEKIVSTVVNEFNDFLKNGGKIDLGPVDANTKVAGDQSFVFDGATPNGADGHIFYKENLKKGTTIVEIDYGSSEFQVVLKGVNHDLSKSDFIL
ncbi:MAG: hypothetical protein ABW003_03080 [Microvirga sp.]